MDFMKFQVHGIILFELGMHLCLSQINIKKERASKKVHFFYLIKDDRYYIMHKMKVPEVN